MININSFNQYNNYGQQISIDRDYSNIAMNSTTVSTGFVGKLIPFFVREMMPDQTMRIEHHVGIQFMPFVSTLMHEMTAVIKTYFVPCRLIDPDNWEDYIMGGVDGRNAYPMPHLDLKKLKDGRNNDLTHSILDYMGYPINNTFVELPSDNTNYLKATAYPIWAYNRIYNDHVRPVDVEPTEIDKNNIEALPCLWQFDYFTRARVYQQRGAVPMVPLSNELGTSLELKHNVNTVLGTNYQAINHTTWSLFQDMQGFQGGGNVTLSNDDGKTIEGRSIITDGGDRYYAPWYTYTQQTIEPHNLEIEGVGINLNDLYMSMGIMAVLINNAKITYRYIDFLEQRYGIQRQDARLQMAEYISTQKLQITSQGIVQQSYGNVEQGETPQGWITSQQTGQGITTTEYTAQEHGYIMSILEIKPATVYSQGLPRLLQCKTRFEWATPELANMPDREIYKGELYYTQETEDKDNFGWTGIYDEYRTMFNQVSGLLRPDAKAGLQSYTLARLFTEKPDLTLEFLQCQPDMDRVLQFQNEPDLIYFIENRIETRMPLPLMSNPAELLNL